MPRSYIRDEHHGNYQSSNATGENSSSFVPQPVAWLRNPVSLKNEVLIYANLVWTDFSAPNAGGCMPADSPFAFTHNVSSAGRFAFTRLGSNSG
ncbi:MAG TPA: hypothetical protein VI685_01555 [Candidatus Angelobacter sp.]